MREKRRRLQEALLFLGAAVLFGAMVWLLWAYVPRREVRYGLLGICAGLFLLALGRLVGVYGIEGHPFGAQMDLDPSPPFIVARCHPQTDQAHQQHQDGQDQQHDPPGHGVPSSPSWACSSGSGGRSSRSVSPNTRRKAGVVL